MGGIIRFITGKASGAIVIAVFVALSGLAFFWGSGESGDVAPAGDLPASAESAKVEEALASFETEDSSAALFVFHREGEALTPDDLAAVAAASPGIAEAAGVEALPPAFPAEDGEAMILTVPLDATSDVEAQSARAEALRAAAADGLPDGLVPVMTGPEGFAVDIAAVFEGANFTLLTVTVLVVAFLLIVTYRSPVLWLIPLSVVGLADGVAGIVSTRIVGAFDLTMDASIKGILSVLVFGAGTNYALLLIARYRDELRVSEDRREAMATALRGAGPAIIASGGTVALSLATLLFASLGGNVVLGLACAIGVVVAMAFALALLPATLVLFPRGIFWPVVPRVGDDQHGKGFWFKLGTGVSKRPAVVAGAGIVVLIALAAIAPSIKVGLAQTERFTSTPEAVVGQELLNDHFPDLAGAPAIVVSQADQAEAVAQRAAEIEGVASAVVGDSNGTLTRIDVALSSPAETEEALATVERLRAELSQVDGAGAIVGGLDAQALDEQAAQDRDQLLLFPLILAVVFVVLLLLLRSLVAPILLLLTVVGSFFASVGASWLLFTSVFGFPALDTSVLLFSFLFLVALGVDYNIFLVTRAREEAAKHGTRDGMIRSLSATGGVITSAGILLAAVFAALGVLPLITLTQIGIIVCVGVLLDTLLVRTVIVPALAFLTGDRFWWPSKGAPGGRHPAHAKPAHAASARDASVHEGSSPSEPAHAKP
ncbi:MULTISPECIES: MMPL family transporter [unclassified Pseudoclavibacter]|uniref:MMPL family transporter n=1 Tax=unclassified Pseudoclavibacter TaxID=2615177 RepID=UPI001BA7C295|nr:MMPL family transporter [Pseudoclavibacter sp. Marseille-Q4354]MBS3179716.1 MMPL family transporter [Pseudoclavibacter sp. Marseille-Q4354]